MLELWGMWSTPSLPSLPGPLWPGVIVPGRVLSMGQKDLNYICLNLNLCPIEILDAIKIKTFILRIVT